VKTWHIPHFEKIESRPATIIATFHLATERISKWLVIQLPRYSLTHIAYKKLLSC